MAKVCGICDLGPFRNERFWVNNSHSPSAWIPWPKSVEFVTLDPSGMRDACKARENRQISAMVLRFAFLMPLILSLAASEEISITYNGFRSANLSLDGIAEVTPSGALRLTNETKKKFGHAFFPNPVNFKNSSAGSDFSFSTTFVFAIISEYPVISSHGMAFVVAPTRGLPGALPSQYLGLFNETSNGNSTNRVFAVELDTILSGQFADINNNHVGIDINGLKSEKSCTAGYYAEPNKSFESLLLYSGELMQAWVEYDGDRKLIEVTIAPINLSKPATPLLSLDRDLSSIFTDAMYVGFSSSTGGKVLTSHYVLGWSFRVNGEAQSLSISQLPKLPGAKPKRRSKFFAVGLPVISSLVAFFAISGIAYQVRSRRKFAELVDNWEMDYGSHRFKYQDLHIATKGFRDTNLLGSGGFGRVYRGVLPTSKVEIAVKRVSHGSRQGMKEFVAEIVSIGRLRHRNLVRLLGYCRRNGELLLVYDYMPKGSLDKFLFHQPNYTLNWSQRFRVIKGVASALLYLHEEWEKVVIHRDVKASNVLLDGELNGRLGDFGLARLYDHGTDPETTHVGGTLGYLAPEHARTGKATTASDVFSFGAFLLEVACGRRPIERKGPELDVPLLEWVFSFWSRGEILGARDPKLGNDFAAEEMELVLKLGLLCSHSEPMARPTMRQVVQYLAWDLPMPKLSLGLSSCGVIYSHREGYPSVEILFTYSTTTVVESLLSGGR